MGVIQITNSLALFYASLKIHPYKVNTLTLIVTKLNERT